MSRRKRKIERRGYKRNRVSNCEALEARMLLTTGFFSVSEMADKLRPHLSSIQGLTVITHGFQPTNTGDGMSNLSHAVYARADAYAADSTGRDAWLLDYDIRSEATLAGFDVDLIKDDDGENNGSILDRSPSEIILQFDWAEESNELSSGWGEAAGDALFSLITGLGLVNPAVPSIAPSLHFIAHSFGSAVTSEAIERLAFYDVPVDQVTLLDPHDFDESGIPVDEDQRLFDLGQPQHAPDGTPLAEGYGATVWDNVAFADVYYQTRPIPFIPEGRPLPGAFNTNLSDHPGVGDLTVLNPHSAVWQEFYIDSATDRMPVDHSGGDLEGTYGFDSNRDGFIDSSESRENDSIYLDVNGNGKLDSSEPSVATDQWGHFNFGVVAAGTYVVASSSQAETGYAWSRVGGGETDRPVSEFNFYDGTQDHEHTPAELKPGELTDPSDRLSVASAKQAPVWDGASFIVNGDFSAAGDRFDADGNLYAVGSLGYLTADNLIPGWSHHGGGGSGRVEREGNNHYLRLDASAISRTHNAFYLDQQAGILEFDLRVPTADSGDTLVIRIGDQIVGTVALDATSTVFKQQRVVVPIELRGKTQTLSFQLIPAVNAPIRAVVNIDNVQIKAGGRSGDIVPISLAALNPGVSEFGIIGWTSTETGRSPLDLAVSENSLRGDHHLQIGGQTVAHVLFSDRVADGGANSGKNFGESGQLYLAPPTDSSTGNAGFSGELELWYRQGEALATVPLANGLMDRLADRTASISEIVNQLVDDGFGEKVPSIDISSTYQSRSIDLGAGKQVQQWLIVDTANGNDWVLVASESDSLSLYRAKSIDIQIVPGIATINDPERVVSSGAAVLEIARLQQRLRYYDYPGQSGRLLVVDGIVGNETRHAAGLFTATVEVGEHENRDSVSGVAYNFINALNAPHWEELVARPNDDFDVVLGPFPPNSPPRYFGTNWLVETIRLGAAAAKRGTEPISMPIGVGSISAPNGPGPEGYHEGHDAGMSVDFLLPIQIADVGDGSVSELESDAAGLIRALETAAFPGVTIREVRTSNSDIADAINAGRISPIAIVDAGYAGGLHVTINPPPPVYSVSNEHAGVPSNTSSGLVLTASNVVAENAGTIVVSVARAGSTESDLVVYLSTSNGDLANVPATVTIPSG
ncbi:MAG: hypothetical protein KDA87_17895, partial [Planctomycetales bacterium]|nr:hypothetical protein [Planctomycetales bacterium]